MNTHPHEIQSALITGAAGFIGYHLCEYLLAKGIPVVGLDNFITGTLQNIEDLQKRFPKLFKFIHADVNANRTWTENINCSLTHVFHLASPACPRQYQKFPLETLLCNSIGLKFALEFTQKINARLIFSSTSEVYGDPQISPQPESYFGYVNPTGPRSCYNEAKRFGEALITTYNKINKSNHGIVRIFNTYGPRMHIDDQRVINNFALALVNKRPFKIHGNGLQTRSFCYISDLVEGLVAYAQSDLSIPINLGNDDEVTILELVAIFQEIWSDQIQLTFAELPGDDPKKRRPDLTLASKHLPTWKREVDLRTGLLKVLKWHQKASQNEKLMFSQDLPISPP